MVPGRGVAGRGWDVAASSWGLWVVQVVMVSMRRWLAGVGLVVVVVVGGAAGAVRMLLMMMMMVIMALW